MSTSKSLDAKHQGFFMSVNPYAARLAILIHVHGIDFGFNDLLLVS